MRVLLFGSTGQLGATLVSRLAGNDLAAFSRREVDVTDHGAVKAAVESRRPDVIINCSAYTNVDGAEDDPSTALAVNAIAVRSMARAAAEAGAALVHYSTDFVFDGTAVAPYREEDRPQPQGFYASSKLLGEWFAEDAGRWYVLRVESLFGGPTARSSFDRIIAALEDGRRAPVFVDRVVSPSYVEDVADATLALLHENAAPGLYHCVNSGATTWFDAARVIAGEMGKPEELLDPVSVNDVQLKVPRPVYAALSNDKLARAGFVMPTWQDALTRYLRRRRVRNPEPGTRNLTRLR
jgi:dTDP-4-dehydrorhamnose reductase